MMTKQQYHIVSFSGGKDSTAMLLEMLERDMKIDCILFCDTGLEFPAMYEHIAKVEKNIGQKITIVKSEHSFEEYMFDVPVRRGADSPVVQKYGAQLYGYGWPGPRMRWCTTMLKDAPRTRFLRDLRKQYEVIEYIGIAADERYRLERKRNQNPNHRHPLMDWGWTEDDCLQYCYARGYDWDGLYEHFKRVSCWCCPLQSLSELRELHQHFPDLWERLKVWDKRTWFHVRADYSAEELEVRFLMEREWIAAGKSIKGKAFFAELKKGWEERIKMTKREIQKKIEDLQSQIDELKIIVTEKNNPFQRGKDNDEYFIILPSGKVVSDIERHYARDDGAYRSANYCTDRKLLEKRAAEETLSRLVWREAEIANAGRRQTEKYRYATYYDDKLKTFVPCLTIDVYEFPGNSAFIHEEDTHTCIKNVVIPFVKEHPELGWELKEEEEK